MSVPRRIGNLVTVLKGLICVSIKLDSLTPASISANYSAAAKTEDEKKEAKKEQETVQTKPQTETYKPDMDKIGRMKADMSNNINAFKKMVYSLIKKQGGIWEDIFAGKEPLTIDAATQSEAIAAIAEDGEWGVEQTAGRILDFAKALSGGDPSKIEFLRDAVKAGFDAAEKVWGGELPEISRKTYDRVMQGFDEWAESASGGADAVAESTAE